MQVISAPFVHPQRHSVLLEYSNRFLRFVLITSIVPQKMHPLQSSRISKLKHLAASIYANNNPIPN